MLLLSYPQCVVLGCIHPSSAKGTKGSLTSQFGRFRVFGVPPGCSEERESEYWLSWPDIAEIILISTSQHTLLDEATLQANPLSRAVWHSQNQKVISAGDVERVEDEEDSLRVTGSGSFPHDDKQVALPVVRVENILADVGFVAGSVQKIKLKTKKRRNRITSITPTVGSITDCTAEKFAINVPNHNLCEARLEEDHRPDSSSSSSSSFLMMTSTVTVDSIGHIDTATSSSQELAYQDTHDYAGEEVLYKENQERVVKDSAMGILIEQPQPLHQSDENGDKDGEIDGNGDKTATSSFFSFADLFDDILMQRRSQIGADEEVHF